MFDYIFYSLFYRISSQRACSKTPYKAVFRTIRKRDPGYSNLLFKGKIWVIFLFSRFTLTKY